MTQSNSVEKNTLSREIKSQATEMGFDLVGIAPAVSPTGFHNLCEWVERGFGGEMEYIERRQAAYEHPKHVLQGVRSIIVLAMNYHTIDSPTPSKNQGLVAKYAWGTSDYHDILRDRLKKLADFVHQQTPGSRTRGVVDTAPLLERDFSRLAGLGWFGKNTMLINKQAGSWLFLAALLTDIELAYDDPHETAHCGTCTRCLEACPTDAFPEPFFLDARKCISYLTIELRNKPIPSELRKGMGQWLFGCDICQDVCPWNRKAPLSSEPVFQPVDDLAHVDAISILKMSEDEFRNRFRHTPLNRPGRAGLLRNAAIVLGNSGDSRAIPALIESLNDVEPLIRGAAAWALGQLGGTTAVSALQDCLQAEDDTTVKNEIQEAIEESSVVTTDDLPRSS